MNYDGEKPNSWQRVHRAHGERREVIIHHGLKSKSGRTQGYITTIDDSIPGFVVHGVHGRREIKWADVTAVAYA